MDFLHTGHSVNLEAVVLFEVKDEEEEEEEEEEEGRRRGGAVFRTNFCMNRAAIDFDFTSWSPFRKSAIVTPLFLSTRTTVAPVVSTCLQKTGESSKNSALCIADSVSFAMFLK